MADEFYTIGSWKGFTTYNCVFCPFDTMDEAQAIEHYLSRHVSKAVEPETSAIGGLVLVADKRGNEMKPTLSTDFGTDGTDQTPDLIEVDGIGTVAVEYVELNEEQAEAIAEKTVAPKANEILRKTKKGSV